MPPPFFGFYSSLLFAFLFSDYLFFAKIDNRRVRAGPDRTVADGKETKDKTGGAMVRVMFFLFSALFISSSRSFFSIVYSTATDRTGWGGT